MTETLTFAAGLVLVVAFSVFLRAGIKSFQEAGENPPCIHNAAWGQCAIESCPGHSVEHTEVMREYRKVDEFLDQHDPLLEEFKKLDTSVRKREERELFIRSYPRTVAAHKPIIPPEVLVRGASAKNWVAFNRGFGLGEEQGEDPVPAAEREREALFIDYEPEDGEA